MQVKKMRWYRDKYLYICFGLCLLLALLSFGYYIWSGDGIFTLMTDFNAQQIPFSVAVNDAIKSGELGWMWNVDLGTNIIGAFSFYNLGSPFFWVSVLFPAESFPYLVGWLYILKYALAGAFAYLYIRRFINKQEFAVLGAVLYAFSGFQSVNLLFYHFHDVVAFFPLLLLGIEKLVVDGKKGYFAAAVFINCLLNYFFFAGEAIFLVAYFLCRFGIKKNTLIHIIYGCVEGLLGIGMACFLFLPSLLFIANNPKAASNIFESGQWLYSEERYLEIIKGIFLPGEPMYDQAAIAYEDFTSTSAYLPGVGMVLVFAYMMREKSWIRKLLLLTLGVSLLPVLNSIFYGFSQDYRRWWYMPILIMAVASAKVMDCKEKYDIKKAVWIVSGIIVAFAVWMAVSPWEMHSGNEIYSANRFWGSIIFVLLCNILLIVTQKSSKLFAKIVWVMVISVSALTTTWMIYQYRVTAQEPKELKEKWDVDRTLNSFDINYRYDVDNSGAYIGGVHPLRTYNSTITGSIFEMHQEMGLSRTPAVVLLDVPGVMQWLGGKYYITYEMDENLKIVDTLDYGEREAYVVEQSACPIGFTYENYILKSEFRQLDNQLRGIAVLMGLIIPDEIEENVSEYLSKVDVCTINEDTLQHMEDYIQINSDNIVNIYEMNAKGFKAEANREKDTYAFFSVPNDVGWTAYVNGTEVDIININGMMAIPIAEGESDIQFVYEIPGFKIGVIISLIAFLLWIAYWFYAKKLVVGNKRE